MEQCCWIFTRIQFRFCLCMTVEKSVQSYTGRYLHMVVYQYYLELLVYRTIITEYRYNCSVPVCDVIIVQLGICHRTAVNSIFVYADAAHCMV